MLEKNLVSIITVSYQAEKTIEKTMKSVLMQQYSEIEYIVKDGGSQDKTNSIVDQYKEKFEEKGIKFCHIISQDNGIYSAMNQAVTYCNGDWVMFLNADDSIYSANVLSDVFCKTQLDKKIDIIYGDADFVDEDTHFLWKGNMDVVMDKCPYCHQSSFVRKEWMKTHPFDETFQITADYDFIVKSYKENALFLYTPIIISSFYRGGASGTRLVQDRFEHRKVQLRYQTEKERKKIKNKIKFCFIVCSAWLQEILFWALPDNIVKKIRHYRKKKKMKVIGEKIE